MKFGEFPENAILLTTLETNRDRGYGEISGAISPTERFYQFLQLDYPRKVLTVEPICDFDMEPFVDMISLLNFQGALEYVWIGFNSKPEEVQLPEPSEEKVQRLIRRLEHKGIEVRGKELRGLYVSSNPRSNPGMYPETETWNPFVGCRNSCVYCVPAFQRQLKRWAKNNCQGCYNYEPHYHPERLERIPSAKVIFVCGNGDIAYCRQSYVRDGIIPAIKRHNERCSYKTYYFQSKFPRYFENFLS